MRIRAAAYVALVAGISWFASSAAARQQAPRADFAASEDAVQEALIAASLQWTRDGVPDSPRAWLIQVASRRMTDHSRSEAARRRRVEAAARNALLHPAARAHLERAVGSRFQLDGTAT